MKPIVLGILLTVSMGVSAVDTDSIYKEIKRLRASDEAKVNALIQRKMHKNEQVLASDYNTIEKAEINRNILLLKSYANSGDSNSQYLMGLLLFDLGEEDRALSRKNGTQDFSGKNYRGAEEWLSKAIAKNHPEAMLTLGYMRKNGLGGNQSDLIASEYFFKSGVEFHNQNKRELALQSYEFLKAADAENLYSDSLRTLLFPKKK